MFKLKKVLKTYLFKSVYVSYSYFLKYHLNLPLKLKEKKVETKKNPIKQKKEGRRTERDLKFFSREGFFHVELPKRRGEVGKRIGDRNGSPRHLRYF